MSQAVLRQLHATLNARHRPEDVVQELLQLPVWSSAERQQLGQVVRQAQRWNPWSWSSMSSDFWRPVGMERQLRKAAELFPHVRGPLNAASDPQAVQPYVRALWDSLGVQRADPDFQNGRLNRAQRLQAGIEMGNHAYNKRFRLAWRLERKRQRVQRQLRQRALTLASKSRLASQLSWEEFSRDAVTAAFIAYYTASANRRSVFSASGQERARDEVADLLLKRCHKHVNTNWYAIAHVYPTPDVLAHLSAEQQGELLGRTYALLEETATLLQQLWNTSTFQRQTMIVKRGDDSSTWNLLAGAWNQLRDLWMNALHALNAQAILEASCPGKVMRLMAADVVFMHAHFGTGALDPNTSVWAALPLPWQVLHGEASCTHADVEAACHAANLDPVKSGWCGPRSEAQMRPFTPTPELVHGVAVGHPGLAAWLRRQGVFSGKPLRSAN